MIDLFQANDAHLRNNTASPNLIGEVGNKFGDSNSTLESSLGLQSGLSTTSIVSFSTKRFAPTLVPAYFCGSKMIRAPTGSFHDVT